MPPRMLIAPDSFKGSLSARAAAQAIAAGIRRAIPDVTLHLCPMADGGEGTLAALTAGTALAMHSATVSDPLGRPVNAPFGVDKSQNRAVVELAAASGLTLLADNERDPLRASTRGTGELVLAAARQLGPDGEVLLGLGGSATNDAGTGLLRALGVRFLDAAGHDLPEGGLALRDLARVELGGMQEEVLGLHFRLACDVTNPLTGSNGAAAVYGPQKGASPADVLALDAALTHFAEVVARQTGRNPATLRGGGAAGGTAAGLWSLLGATLEAGAPLVAEASGLRRALAEEEWNLLWTGEGCLDTQSAAGKVVSEVARLGHAAGVPVVALAGAVRGSPALTGLCAAFALADGPLDLVESQQRAAELLSRQAEQVTRLWQAAKFGTLPARS